MSKGLTNLRSCHLTDLESEDLDRIVDEIKSFAEAAMPEAYTANVYKDHVTCSGDLPIGITIEIEGPNEQTIKRLDEKLYAKIIEICEREGIESHECW
ncbi:MAG: hypothetical protein ACFFCW_48415 [Candidatus Hodarchaeota archaeon]